MTKKVKDVLAQDDDEIVGEAVEEKEETEIDGEHNPQEVENNQEIDLENVEMETNTEPTEAAELDAINTDNETAQELNAPEAEIDEEIMSDAKGKEDKALKKTTPKTKAKAKKEQKKKSARSKKYSEAATGYDKKRLYPVKEAVKIVKEHNFTKFDPTIELSVHLQKSKKKGADENVRGVVKLPSGTAKKKNVIIFTDALAEKIKKGWAEFDILVATPADMPKLAPLAKILGPKGKMPNPKNGTVTETPKEAIEELAGETVEYRMDASNNLHIPIAKLSWDEEKILANYQAVLKTLVRLKMLSVTLSSTMGPGVKVDITKK